MGIGRMAMQALKGSGHFLKSNMGANAGEVALRVVPDIGFGVLAGVQTPGDLGDKLIAGGTQAAGWHPRWCNSSWCSKRNEGWTSPAEPG